MIGAIVFDFDGTLADFRRTDSAALQRKGAERVYAYLCAHELAMPTFAQFSRRQRWLRRRIRWTTRLACRQPDCRRALRQLCLDYRLQRDEASLAKLGWLWYEPIAETATVPPDVRPTLAALRDNRIPLGMVVNTSHQGAVIDEHLLRLGLLEFFPVRVYSSEIGAANPQLFPIALDQLGTSAANTLFVGNHLKDISTARRLGMNTALRIRSTSRRAKQLSDYVIRDIEELLDIVHVSASPALIATNPIPPLQLDVPVTAK